MHYEVATFAANSHTELELKLSTWLRKKRPKEIIAHEFAADGAEYTYCYVLIYVLRELPLPKKRGRLWIPPDEEEKPPVSKSLKMHQWVFGQLKELF